MAFRLIERPTFPQLIQALVTQISWDCSHAPLVPKWVLTPTSTTARHLRECFAQASVSAPLTGVRVVPFNRLVAKIKDELLLDAGFRWNVFLDYLLQEFVQKLPDDATLSALKGIPGGHQQLKPTLLDLADGGFGPSDIEILSELAADPALPPLDRETLEFFTRWLAAVSDTGWEPLQLQSLARWIDEVDAEQIAAATDCETGFLPHVHLYGFYDFTDVNTSILAALCGKIDVTLYFPSFQPGGKDHPAFHFAREILQDLQARLGGGAALSSLAETPPASQSESFFLKTFPEGRIPERPEFLTFQSVSSTHSEALSAAVQIKEWMAEDPSLSPTDIMVVAPEITPYFEALRSTFSAFQIPLRFVDVPVDEIDRLPVREMLRHLWKEQAPTDKLLAYLRDFSSMPALGSVDLDHFETELRKLSIAGGQAWISLRKILESGAQENRTIETQFTPGEIDFISLICRTWLEWQQSAFTESEARLFLNGLKAWVTDSRPIERLLSQISEIGKVFPGASLPAEMIFSNLRDEERTAYSDPPEHRGVLALSLMRARGITARGLVFLGLSSNQFPARVQEDPLLGDPTRQTLARSAQAVGHRIPIKTLATNEMELLFFLINTAAQKLHWVIPETDEDGRSVSPTPWVLRYIQRWSSTANEQQALRRIPRSPKEQAYYLLGLDPREGSFLPPEYAQLLSQDLAIPRYGSECFRHISISRQYRSQLAAWDGLIPDGKLEEPSESNRVMVTQLESLARCPYRFYVGAVARLTSLTPFSFTDQLDPLSWGSLLHGTLEALFRQHLDGSTTTGDIAARLLAHDGLELRRMISNLPEDLRNQLQLLPPPLATAQRTQLFQALANYFSAIQESADASNIPVHLEKPLRGPVPSFGNLIISGKADRIDRTRPKGFLIIDYKSGKNPEKKVLSKDSDPFQLGFYPQAVFYPYLFMLFGLAPEAPTFSYQFLKDRPLKTTQVEGANLADGLLTAFLEILQNGAYPASPNELFEARGLMKVTPCAYCDYRSLCRRDEREMVDTASRHFKELVPLRFRQIEALAPEEVS